MDKDEVMGHVIRAVAQVQETSGRRATQITASTRPLRDLPGFDSLSGIEATIYISELLGHEFSDDYNPFVSQDGRRALTIQEVTEEICSTLEAGEDS